MPRKALSLQARGTLCKKRIYIKEDDMNSLRNVNHIKRKLLRMPNGKIKEIEDFVDFIWSRISKGKKRKIEKLEGIWEGLGFEKIDIEKSISDIRKYAGESLMGREKEWNI